jgi:uncharacterized protein (TIGR03437 family)
MNISTVKYFLVVVAPQLFLTGFAVAQTAAPSIEKVVNAASFAQGPIAPGTIVCIFGSGLTTSTLAVPALPLPTEVEGTSVSLDGKALPLLLVSPTQINAQLPFEIQNGSAQLSVANGKGSRASFNITVAPASPGIFTTTSDGTGAAIGLHADSTPLRNLSGQNGRAGETVVLFGTGLGAVDSLVQAGTASPSSPLAATVLKPTVLMDGRPAEVTFSGLAPGLAGVYQIKFVVPDGASGDVVTTISVGGATSNSTIINVSGVGAAVAGVIQQRDSGGNALGDSIVGPDTLTSTAKIGAKTTAAASIGTKAAATTTTTTTTTTASALAYPVASIFQAGVPGTTSYGYAVTATDSLGNTITTNVYTVLGNATLSSSNYNIIKVTPANTSGTFMAPVGACAVRRVTPSPVGTIGSIANCAAGGTVSDMGVRPTDTTAPPADTSGWASYVRNIYASGPNSPFPDTLMIGGQGIALSHTSGTDGWFNTCVGFGPCAANSTGSYNTAMGADSFRYNTTGSYSTAVGVDALWLNTTGNQNSAFGMTALYRNTTGGNNSAFGAHSLERNTTAYNNAAFGYYALNTNAGDNNAGFGAQALQLNTTGTQNSALGAKAMYANTTGTYNTAVGWGALSSNNGGNRNTAVGHIALGYATGGNNTAVGQQSAYWVTTGQNNVALGAFAGFTNGMNADTTGSNNTWLGENSGPGSPTQYNYQTVVGSDATANCSNCIVLGRPTDSLIAPGAVATPAGSLSPCTAGQIAFDASYFYTCVAPNTWRRAATSSW